MSDLMLGSLPVIAARVVVPRIGVWYAELTVDSETAPSGLQTLRSEVGGLTLTGTVRTSRTAVYVNRTELLLVGGRDGLSRSLTPREYSEPTIRILLNDLCRETGEVLSATSDASVLDSGVARWTRTQATAGDVLAHIVEATGCAWRILSDGSLWIGRETWPTISLPDTTTDLVHNSPSQGAHILKLESLVGELAPGRVWLDRRISHVVHTCDDTEATTLLWFADSVTADPPQDRLRAGLDALIQNALKQTRYHALYPATVLSQAGNGTVDLQCDSPLLPMLVGVKIRTTSPGSSTKVSVNARCLVAFEGGAAPGPVVVAWENSSHETEHTFDVPTFKIGANATRGVARRNDTVDKNTAFTTWVTAVQAALSSAGYPISPLNGSTIGTISSASARGKCD